MALDGSKTQIWNATEPTPGAIAAWFALEIPRNPNTPNPAELGLVAGSAMLLNLVVAAMFGVLIPFALKFFRQDPALASSILITTVTDVAGFFFLLALASWILIG